MRVVDNDSQLLTVNNDIRNKKISWFLLAEQ